jgi:hypothetical protein
VNRDCNGDFFRAGGKRYYRCLLDSTVIQVLHVVQGEKCPNCLRIIDAQDFGDVEVKIVRQVIVDSRTYLLPNDDQVKS